MYGLFAKLPETVGIGLFTGLGVFALYFGVRAILQYFEGRGWTISRNYRNFFWLVLSSELVGGVLSNKLEILIVGLCFVSVWLLFAKNRPLLAGVILATTLDWKFLSLPLIAFLSVYVSVIHRQWKFVTSVVLTLLFWRLAPIVVYSTDLRTQMKALYEETMLAQLQDNVNFDHIFHWLTSNLGLSFTFSQLLIIIVVVAGVLGLCYGVQIWKQRKDASSAELAVLLSFAFSGFFVTCFSPLSQAQAYILYVPLLMACVLMDGKIQNPWRSYLRFQVFMSWIVISLFFSDLFPHDFRVWAELRGAKPFGVALLFLSFSICFRKIQVLHDSRNKPSHSWQLRKA